MMPSSNSMSYEDVHNIRRFTENTVENKEKEAKKTASIILAGIQLFDNYIKGIKKMSAYDAASTICSHANWIKNNTLEIYKDASGNKIVPEVGKIYYIDFGNTFYGELSYFHYGLCIGKKENKILVVPITSGSQYFSTCYHPINNPYANRKHRQALTTEGFQKDCVLKIDDTKFISAGRIIKENVQIQNVVLKEIQEQVFHVEFPTLEQKYNSQNKKIIHLEEKVEYQKNEINKLKTENNHMKQILINNKLI